MPATLDTAGIICTLACMTHADIINKWPSLSDFADDLAVEYGTAKAMRRRASIPVNHWPKVMAKAAARGIEGISLDVLVASVARERVA